MKAWARVSVLAAAVALASSRLLSMSTLAAVASGDDAPHAPGTLVETGLYVAGTVGQIDSHNRPFSPQYPLWSDGATKRRWIHLPPGTTVDVTREDSWEFPVGTKFWKEFSFRGRKVETRFLWRATPVRWVAASYVWNAQETGALLAPEGGIRGVADVAPGRAHNIPAVNDCAACHGGQRLRPLGFNALQLSTDRDPNAIHGESLQPGMVTLQTLVAEGLTSPARAEFARRPPKIATSNPQTRTVLGYLAANCASCHNGEGEIAALGPVLRQRELLQDGDAVARALVNQRTSWQVPGAPEGTSVLIDPTSPDTSAILVRMRSRRPSSQMPPLGTALRDDEALDLLCRWIGSQAAAGHQ
jgi:cytochrome c553